MPVYDYCCETCGPFTVLRPMAEYRDPHDCPACGSTCRRAFLQAPHLAGMDPDRRKAMDTNERNAHEPRRSKGHGPGCACCGPSSAKTSSETSRPQAAAKSFPAARPWMISH